MLIAFEAGMPRADRIISACSLTSGSIRAYRFADLAISKTPFGIAQFNCTYIIRDCAYKCKTNVKASI